MLKCECINKIKNNNNVIKGYVLRDENGNTLELEAVRLKEMIFNGEIEVKNLKLTSDGRLINKVLSELEYSNTTSLSEDDLHHIAKELIIRIDQFNKEMFNMKQSYDNTYNSHKITMQSYQIYDRLKNKGYKNAFKELDDYNLIDIVFRVKCKKMNNNTAIMYDADVVVIMTDSCDGRPDKVNVNLQKYINNILDRVELTLYRDVIKAGFFTRVEIMKQCFINTVSCAFIASILALIKSANTKESIELAMGTINKSLSSTVGIDDFDKDTIINTIKSAITQTGNKINIDTQANEIEVEHVKNINRTATNYGKSGIKGLFGIFKR